MLKADSCRLKALPLARDSLDRMAVSLPENLRPTADPRWAALPSFATLTLLIVVLILTVTLWWPWAGEFSIGYDDRQMMKVSQQLAAGHWRELLAPQDIHVIPLFRLIRAWFDWHFPERFQWMHAVVLAAQLISTILLFALSRRFLEAPWAALATACLFAWSALGGEAVLVKSESTYVLSLPCLLGGLYCISRIGSGRSGAWAAATFLCLLAAVGLHSMPGAAAIPSVLLGYYLLRSSSERRTNTDTLLAWLACLAPMLIAIALWLNAGEKVPAAEHRPSMAPALGNAREMVSRCWTGLEGVIIHFSFLVRRGPPSPAVQVAAALALAALLFLVRKRLSARWIVTAAAFTAGPVFTFFFGRGAPDFQPSRYAYQSFVLVAVAAGASLDWFLTAVSRGKPKLQTGVILLVIAAVPMYYVSQNRSLALKTAVLHEEGSMSRESWIRWKRFLEALAAGARASSMEFRLPESQPRPKLSVRDIYYGCFPTGTKGIRVLSRDDAHAIDCLNFQKAIVAARAHPGPLSGEPLPAQMAVADYSDASPSGNFFRCYVVARHGEPDRLSLAPGVQTVAAPVSAEEKRP